MFANHVTRSGSRPNFLFFIIISEWKYSWCISLFQKYFCMCKVECFCYALCNARIYIANMHFPQNKVKNKTLAFVSNFFSLPKKRHIFPTLLIIISFPKFTIAFFSEVAVQILFPFLLPKKFVNQHFGKFLLLLI